MPPTVGLGIADIEAVRVATLVNNVPGSCGALGSPILFGLLHLINHPVHFVILTGVTFFAWGEIFSLFPSITGDPYGWKWATTNYGITYTAKGVASIFAGPVAALTSVETGKWVGIFWAKILCDLIAAALALPWLNFLGEDSMRFDRGRPGTAVAEAARGAHHRSSGADGA